MRAFPFARVFTSRLSRNFYTELSLQGWAILLTAVFAAAAFIVFVIWPSFAGICAWNLGGTC